MPCQPMDWDEHERNLRTDGVRLKKSDHELDHPLDHAVQSRALILDLKSGRLFAALIRAFRQWWRGQKGTHWLEDSQAELGIAS